MSTENRSSININTPKFRLFDSIVDRFYSYELSGKENIDQIRCIQSEAINQNGKPLPMLDVWNHEGTADPAIAGHLTVTQFGDVATDIVIPVSYHYVATDAYRLYSFAVKHARKEGYVMPEIDQSYRGRDMQMSPEEEAEFRKGQFQRSKNFIGMLNPELEKGALISIAPEGHRSYSLNPPEAGAGAIVRAMEKLKQKGEIQDAIIIPRGIFRNQSRKSLTVRMGRPSTPEEVIEKAIGIAERYCIPLTPSLYAHALMLLVRDLLPEEMHGVYSGTNDEEYMRKVYSDQIKLITERITVNGKMKKIVRLRDFTQPYIPGV